MTGKHDDPKSEENLRLFNEGVILRPDKHNWCKGTGAILKGVTIVGPTIENGTITRVDRIETHWLRCKCPDGQFWQKFHPLNVQARLVPHWRAELKEALRAEAQRICSSHFDISNHPDFRRVTGDNFDDTNTNPGASKGARKPSEKQ